MLLSTRIFRLVPVLLMLALVLPTPDRAGGCGPFFPTSALESGDAGLLQAPTADFHHEIAALLPKANPALRAIVPPPPPERRWDAPDYAAQTEAADAADLQDATHDFALVQKVRMWRSNLLAGKPTELPAGLPEEFALYEKGAALYHKGDLAAAREQWQKVLGLPEKQRTHRSLWATYMIGRSLVDADPAKAAATLAKIPQLAKPGGPYADPLGLACASLGWQARALWKQNQTASAIELFLQQAAAGEPLATPSLRDCARDLLAGDEPRLRRAATDPASRLVITAYIISRGTPYSGKLDFGDNTPDHAFAVRWLKILDGLELKEVPGSDRLAWAAYLAGDMKSAQRWLTLGGKNGRDTPLGQWIQAKLDLRNGDVDQAAACLAVAAKSFPVTEDWPEAIDNPGDDHYAPAQRAAGELALLRLGRRHYTEALDLLIRNNFDADAAYVAERVLTVDELKAYVDKNFPKYDPNAGGGDHPALGQINSAELRELLARRLTRLGRWKEARAYFSPDNQVLLDQYIKSIRDGNDKTRSNAQRAASLWQAAKLARDDGIALLSTSVEPDDAILEGQFQTGRTREAAALAPLSPEEKKRVADSAPDPDKRWHYRYTAADHAWAAAQLMPNETDELAKLLIEAGGWIKAKDPKAADRFYKALVKRCGATDLGQQAAKLHWFPPLPKPAAATQPQ